MRAATGQIGGGRVTHARRGRPRRRPTPRRARAARRARRLGLPRRASSASSPCSRCVIARHDDHEPRFLFSRHAGATCCSRRRSSRCSPSARRVVDHHPQRRPVGRLGARPHGVPHRRRAVRRPPGPPDPGRVRRRDRARRRARAGQRRAGRVRPGAGAGRSRSARSTSSAASTSLWTERPPDQRRRPARRVPEPRHRTDPRHPGARRSIALVVLVVVGYVHARLRGGPRAVRDRLEPRRRRARRPPRRRAACSARSSLSGALAGLAGVLYAARYGTVDADRRHGNELAVVAAVVIGGVAIFGGSGTRLRRRARRAAAGHDQPRADRSSKVDAFWQQAAIGALLLVAIVLDRLLGLPRRRRPAQKERAPCR